jgi:hypothetical protein
MTSLIKVTIETTFEGGEPGDSITVEFEHDPAGVELILTPSLAPSASLWQQFAYADAPSRRASALA